MQYGSFDDYRPPLQASRLQDRPLALYRKYPAQYVKSIYFCATPLTRWLRIL
jgi:hypothetical protein